MVGYPMYDATDKEIGKVVDVVPNPTTMEAEWVVVQSGGLKRRKHLVPASAAHDDGERVRVPYEVDLVRAAPGPDWQGSPTPQLAETLSRHYGLPAEGS